MTRNTTSHLIRKRASLRAPSCFKVWLQELRALAAMLMCVVCLYYTSAAKVSAQTLHLDAPPNPDWPNPSSVSDLADGLLVEADKLDAYAQIPSAASAWRRMAAAILRAHGSAPLTHSSPTAIGLVMTAIRRDMDPYLNTPAGELFVAEWNARADPTVDPMPEFARLLAAIAEMPAVSPPPCACKEGNELLERILPVSIAATTAPDLMQSTAAMVEAANQAAFALCAMNSAAFENSATRKKIADQVNDAVNGLNDPATRANAILRCQKIGAMGQCIQALNEFRSVASATTAARSDRIPDALRAMFALPDPATSARSLKQVAEIISCMTQARQINVEDIALPLRNFARSLTRYANSQEQLGLSRIEKLAQDGFDVNDPSLATIFVAQKQLVDDINMLARLSRALTNDQTRQLARTKQLTAVIQMLCAGLKDAVFSDLFRERLHAMDRQLKVLLAAEDTPNMSQPMQAEIAVIHQRWIEAWAMNEPAKALEYIEDFVRWAAAKRALDALDAAPIAWPDARLDWTGSRDALRLCVSDGEGALTMDNMKAMKPFLAPLQCDAAASLALGLRLSTQSNVSAKTGEIIQDLCSMQHDKSIQVISALLRLEQERQTLLKTNPNRAAEFLQARNEWVAQLPPSLQDRLPDGMLPPATP